jgi:hypothetical protein
LGGVDGAQPEFEDDPAGRVLTLDIWDSRFLTGSTKLTPASPPLPTQPRLDV